MSHPQAQVSQPQEHLPRLLSRISFRAASPTMRTTAAMMTISQIFTLNHLTNIPISRTASAAIQATAHCHSTTPAAHLGPSSRRMEAMAATQGV